MTDDAGHLIFASGRAITGWSRSCTASLAAALILLAPAPAAAGTQDGGDGPEPLDPPRQGADAVPRRNAADLESPLAVPLPRPAAAPAVPRLPDARPSLRDLEIDLGPITKEVTVGEGTSGADLARIAAVPHTRVGFVAEGGNTLRDPDLRRLGRLGRVHVYLRAPVLDVHLEVVRRLPADRELTVRVPEKLRPDPRWIRRLPLAGPGRTNVILEGAPTPERLAPLQGLRRGAVSVRLPAGGLSKEVREALGRLEHADLEIVVPPRAGGEALASLEGLPIAALVLETEGNRLDPRIVEAAPQLSRRLRVVVDRRLTREDLVQLRGLPGLELQVRVDGGEDVPRRITDLLLASEGDRAR